MRNWKRIFRLIPPLLGKLGMKQITRFQSDYFYVTNTGETADFTINVSSLNLPEGWNLMWCHEIQGEGGCNFNPSLTLEFPQMWKSNWIL